MCDDFGMQIFIRGKKGIQRFNKIKGSILFSLANILERGNRNAMLEKNVIIIKVKIKKGEEILAG